jgi:membrane-associated phospholipid phosphatase
LLSGDVVLAWNATLINAIETARTSPLLASRAMAMVHTAMYDAIDAVEPTYSLYPVPGLADAPPAAAHSFPEVAAAKAADLIVDGLFPAQAAAFDAQLQSFLAGYPNAGQAISASLSWGQTVANAVMTWRSTDGSTRVVPYTPGTGPGAWQPTPPGFLAALSPQWPSVTPWAMTSGSQFRPSAPPALTSSDYATAFNEVESLGRIDSTARTADQTQIALFWKDAIGTAYAFGHWNKIAEGVSVAQGLNLLDDARLFAVLNISTADALIACWDAKYAYNFWRPVTAIPFAGDSAINPATVSDPTWTPLIVTPNFPSYMSAHSTVSGASATVLTALFGLDYAFSVGSDGLPGVTRSFSSFAAAAAEAGQSRIYGGIHFQFDNQAGLATGGALGQFVVQNFLVPVPQEGSQGDSQAGPATGGASGQFVAQNPVPMVAMAFLVTSPTNGASASGVVPGGQQTITATLPVSVLVSPNSAWATGHTLVTRTPPGKPAYSRTVDGFFMYSEGDRAADVAGDDTPINWPH